MVFRIDVRRVAMLAITCNLAACVSNLDQQTVNADLVAESWVNERHYTASTKETQDTLFAYIHSQQLQDYLREAIAANYDLQAAAWNLAAQGLAWKQSTGELLPDITAVTEKAKEHVIEPITNERISADSVRAGLSVSWELDVWGRIWQARAAERTYHRVQQWDFEGSRDSLTGLVCRRWFEARHLRTVIRIETDRLNMFRNREASIKERYRSGLARQEDVVVAQTFLNRTQANILAASQQLGSLLRELEVLLGRPPNGTIAIDTSPLEIMPPVVSVPSVVLARRPDIQAAFSNIIAKRYEKASAYRALLPRFSLSGDINRSASRYSGLDSATTVWTLVGGLAQSLFLADLFSAGPIHRAKIVSYEEQAALNNYKGAVLNAIAEVESALANDASLLEQHDFLATAEQNAIELSVLYERRFAEGLVSLLDLLEAQQQVLDIRLSLSENQFEAMNNRITLGLALGLGGPALEP